MQKQGDMWERLYRVSSWALFGGLLAAGGGLAAWLVLAGPLSLWRMLAGAGALLGSCLLAVRLLSAAMLRLELLAVSKQKSGPRRPLP